MRVSSFISKYKYQLLIVTTATIHIVLATLMLLHPDEAYYWDWSRHLDYGYYDHPPMIAWAIKLFSFLPLTELTVRLPAIVASIIVSLATLGILKELTDNEQLIWLGFLLVTISPWLTITSIINTPDAYALLFYTLAIYTGVKFARAQNILWLYLTGVIVALGILSKLTNLFLLPVFFIWLLIDTRQRKWLATIHPWLTAIIGLSGLAVLLVWNYNHHNAMFYRLQELKSGAAIPWAESISEAWGFLITNFLMLAPFIVILIIIKLPHYKTIFSKLSSGWSLVLLASIIPWLYALPACLFSKFQGNWLIFCAATFTILAVGIVNYYINYLNKPNTILWLQYSAYFFMILFLLLNTAPINGIDKLRINEYYGWKLLGELVDKNIEKRFKDKKPVIYAQRYQTAALIAFYSKYHPYVNVCSIGERKSMYDLWTNHQTNANQDVLWVYLTRWGNPVSTSITDAFDSFQLIKHQPLYYNNKVINQIMLYWGENLQPHKWPSFRFDQD